jgi:hypothetical protein
MKKWLAAIGLTALSFAAAPAGPAQAITTATVVRGGFTQPTNGVFSRCMTGNCSANVGDGSSWTGALTGQTSITQLQGTYNQSTKESTGTITETLGSTTPVPGTYTGTYTSDSATGNCPMTAPCTGTLTLQGTFHLWSNNQTGEVDEAITSGAGIFANASGQIVFDFAIQGNSSLAGGYKGTWNCALATGCDSTNAAQLLTPPPGAIVVRGGWPESTDVFTPTPNTASCPSPNLALIFSGGTLWTGSFTGHTVLFGPACSLANTNYSEATNTISESLEIAVPPNPNDQQSGVYTSDDPAGPCSTPGACRGILHFEGTAFGSTDNLVAEVDETIRCDMTQTEIDNENSPNPPGFIKACDGMFKGATGEMQFFGILPGGAFSPVGGIRGFWNCPLCGATAQVPESPIATLPLMAGSVAVGATLLMTRRRNRRNTRARAATVIKPAAEVQSNAIKLSAGP